MKKLQISAVFLKFQKIFLTIYTCNWKNFWLLALDYGSEFLSLLLVLQLLHPVAWLELARKHTFAPLCSFY